MDLNKCNVLTVCIHVELKIQDNLIMTCMQRVCTAVRADGKLTEKEHGRFVTNNLKESFSVQFCKTLKDLKCPEMQMIKSVNFSMKGRCFIRRYSSICFWFHFLEFSWILE